MLADVAGVGRRRPMMNARAGVESRAPLQRGRLSADRAEALAAVGTRAILFNPSKVAAIFWAGGVVAVLSVLPLSHWPRHSLAALVVIAGVCGVACGARVGAGPRLPSWTLHLDVGIATVLASMLASVGVAAHVPFADLYVWVSIFAVLYFRPLVALAHVGAAGAAYAVALVVGPEVDNPVAAWLSLFGTVAVAATIVLGVLSLLRSAAKEDPLTGLANRRWWDERLEEELERSRRTGAVFSIVVADIDGFKGVNDSAGHEAGDHLLREIARSWQAVIRGGGDLLARLGGDEFALLVPGADAMGARSLAKRLAGALPEGVSASLGAATWDRTESASDLQRRADQTMYRVKLRERARAT